MCGCFEVSDFVCFFTFFITAIVALLFVQYFYVYLDSEMDDKAKMFYFCRCLYFFILTFLGCLVFAGVQRRSICLLKWPSRLLVTLLAVGLLTLTIFLWALDRIYKQSVRDLEGKTVKLAIVLGLLFLYFFGTQKFILQIRSPSTLQRQSTGSFNANAMYIFDQSDQRNHPNLVDMFRSKNTKTGGGTSASGNHSGDNSARQINVASNGVNYYQLLLEGSVDSKQFKKWSRQSTSSSIASFSEV